MIYLFGKLSDHAKKGDSYRSFRAKKPDISTKALPYVTDFALSELILTS